jgi:hypothetical protein
MNPFMHRTVKPMEVLNSCSSIPLLVDALLEIGTAVISDVLLLSDPLSQANISCVLKFFYQLVYYFLIQYFVVRMHIAKCFTNSRK